MLLGLLFFFLAFCLLLFRCWVCNIFPFAYDPPNFFELKTSLVIVLYVAVFKKLVKWSFFTVLQVIPCLDKGGLHGIKSSHEIVD